MEKKKKHMDKKQILSVWHECAYYANRPFYFIIGERGAGKKYAESKKHLSRKKS